MLLLLHVKGYWVMANIKYYVLSNRKSFHEIINVAFQRKNNFYDMHTIAGIQDKSLNKSVKRNNCKLNVINIMVRNII